MSQHSLPFFESAEEATRHAIEASGRKFKEVAPALWPDKSVEAATTLLRNALNEARAERLTFDQHLLIARHVGRFDVLLYAAMSCNHSLPTPVAPADLEAKLQRDFIASVQQLESIQRRLSSIQQRTG
ncbi:MAG TPA: hypothetical protein VFA75_10015 [Nevskia sp.]|nr:hypothetical protein [Nevskia sp.]